MLGGALGIPPRPAARLTPFSAFPTLPFPAILLRRENPGFYRKPCCFFTKHCQKAGKQGNPGPFRAPFDLDPTPTGDEVTDSIKKDGILKKNLIAN